MWGRHFKRSWRERKGEFEKGVHFKRRLRSILAEENREGRHLTSCIWRSGEYTEWAEECNRQWDIEELEKGEGSISVTKSFRDLLL